MRKLDIIKCPFTAVNDKYIGRVVDTLLDEILSISGAVLIEGPKWCGKTRTAKEKARSTLYVQDPDTRDSTLKLADTTPSVLLKGKVPRLIDEWQLAPKLWDAVRFSVDERNTPGQFILTGSATPEYDEKRHTGTGRFFKLFMRPMSLFESGESNGSVSLRELFDTAAETEGHSDMTIERLAFIMARGGWPGLLNDSERSALMKMQNYVNFIVDEDMSRVDGVKRNPVAIRNLLKSLSRNNSTMAGLSTIWKDMNGDEDTISDKTVSSYINALRRIFIVEDVPGWNPSLRSKTAIRTAPKRNFVDPSIAIAALNTTPEGLLHDFNTFGFMFESLCVRDLRVYSQPLNGDVFHFRDKNGLEIDIIVQLRDDRWGAIEVKLGSKEIELGAKNLLKLKERIDTERMKQPSFLMIMTSTGYAYKRDDGILVVPIGCLKD